MLRAPRPAPAPPPPEGLGRQPRRRAGGGAQSEAAEEVGELLPVDHPVAVAVGLHDQLVHEDFGAEHRARLWSRDEPVPVLVKVQVRGRGGGGGRFESGLVMPWELWCRGGHIFPGEGGVRGGRVGDRMRPSRVLTSAKGRLCTASPFRISSYTKFARCYVGRTNMDAPTLPRMLMLRPGLNTDAYTFRFGCGLRLMSRGASRASVIPPLVSKKQTGSASKAFRTFS